MENPIEELEEASSPANLVDAMKEIKTGERSVSFGWTDTKLGDSAQSVEDLCDLLAKSKTHALDLDSAKLNNASVEQMCNALKKNKSLRTVVLTNNNLGALAGKAIVDMLKLNKTLKQISLREGNPDIPKATFEAIEAILLARAG